MNIRRTAALAVSAAVATSLAGFATSASASVSVSKLQVWSGGAVTTSVTVAYGTPLTVALKLDKNCPAAYGNANGYGIAAQSSNTSVATVSPGSVAGVHCTDATNFTLTGKSNDVTYVKFSPVAKGPGLQKRLAAVTLKVTVTGAPTTTPGGPPPSARRPAAPAMANAYLNNKTVVTACQNAYKTSGHHWRGALISTIARWSAANKLSTKKDTQYTDVTWAQLVENKVNSLCGI